MILTVSYPASSEIYETTTFIPSFAKDSAQDPPNSLSPPVTIAFYYLV